MTTRATKNETTNPTKTRFHSIPVNEIPDLYISYTVADTMVGIANKNENSVINREDNLSSLPVTITAPDRETPGTTAKA